MKKKSLKVDDVLVVQSLPLQDDFVIEKLDFSQLSQINGGNMPPPDGPPTPPPPPPSGNSGALFICWCK